MSSVGWSLTSATGSFFLCGLNLFDIVRHIDRVDQHTHVNQRIFDASHYEILKKHRTLFENRQVVFKGYSNTINQNVQLYFLLTGIATSLSQ